MGYLCGLGARIGPAGKVAYPSKIFGNVREGSWKEEKGLPQEGGDKAGVVQISMAGLGRHEAMK